MVRYSPPPPDEQSCLSVKSVQNNLVDDKSSSLCRGSSVLSSDVGTGFNADKNAVLEVKREIPTNTNVKLVGSNVDLFSGKANVPTVPFDSLDTVDGKDNVLLSRGQKTAGVVKVDLPPNKAPVALVVKKEVVNKLDDNCTPELLRTPETVQMLLGTREPLVPELMIGLNGSDFRQNLDESYTTSLCLSINQGKCIDELKSGDAKSKVASPPVHADRMKWDRSTLYFINHPE